MDSIMSLKQFRNEGCNSYIVVDRIAKTAAVIDPSMELVESYREFLMENGLRLLFALDTHTHADHYSATHLMRDEFQARVGMSRHSSSKRPDIQFGNGDAISLGEVKIQVLETPGHTPDSVCYLIGGAVFTGDTLFISSSGRTDFPGADPLQQWKSIHEVLARLPGGTLVYPGHDYSERLFSTIEVEVARNPHVLMKDVDAFVAMKNAECLGGANDAIRARVEFNCSASPKPIQLGGAGSAVMCGTMDRSPDRTPSISVEKYVNKLEDQKDGTLFVDVRETDEFAAGHIPQTVNMPLSELGFHLKELQASRQIYVSCLGGVRSAAAAKTLIYLGIEAVVNVSGGFRAWSAAGYPVTQG